jgi:hypothetical protein
MLPQPLPDISDEDVGDGEIMDFRVLTNLGCIVGVLNIAPEVAICTGCCCCSWVCSRAAGEREGRLIAPDGSNAGGGPEGKSKSKRQGNAEERLSVTHWLDPPKYCNHGSDREYVGDANAIEKDNNVGVGIPIQGQPHVLVFTISAGDILPT